MSAILELPVCYVCSKVILGLLSCAEIMLSSVSKVGALAPFVSATSQNVASQLRPVVYAAQAFGNDVKFPAESKKLTSQSMSQNLPKGLAKVTYGVHGRFIGFWLLVQINYVTVKVVAFIRFHCLKHRSSSCMIIKDLIETLNRENVSFRDRDRKRLIT